AYGGMPVSSGLSSSAASIVSLGVSVAGITGMRDKVSASEMTDACVATEQRLGFPCGKQDPWGSLMGWLDSGSKGGGFAEMMDCVPRVDGDGRSKINSFLAPMPEGYSALVFRVAGGAETAGGRYKTNIRVAEGEMGSYLMSISLRNLVRERYPEWSRELDDKSAMGRMYPDMAAADNEVFPPYYKPFYFSFINLRNMGIPLSKEELMELVDELPSEVTKAELREKYGLPADKLEKFTESCRGIGLDLEEIKFDIRGTMRHAVTEQERVEESARALKEKDLDAFFRLQRETHLSLVENYKITPELSMKLIDILDSIGYVRASRLHGPGNGVNVLAWVRSSDADKLAREVKETFYKKHEPFSRLPEGKIDEFIIPFHPGKGADLMFVKGREVGEDLSMPFTAAAICKYIEAEGNLDGSRGLLDVISKAKALEEVNVGILPGEVTIELPGASTVVRYFDPSRNNVITPYSDISKLETSVISKNLTRQIIHRVIAIEREPGLTGKAAGVETNDGEMERIRYVDKSLDIFRAVLGGDKRNVLLRVPVEVLESLGPENAGSFLEKFQEASNSFVELYYMSGMGEAGSSVYGRYGITRKELPEDLIGPEKRSRANTVTLLAVNKGERVDQTTVISRLGNPSMSERNTVLSPVGILNDPAGLVMASILGLKIMEVARKTGSLDKDEIQRDVIEDLKMIYSPEDLKGLTPEDILRLALSDNINHIMRSLEKLIQLLPISPVDPGELKEIYERIRTVISAA
ncbi:MAG TPA: hypothetical protein PKZ41_00895, partial [Candidatus Omnitrophota bacterium]|nr:hypothetical protein [Candidatus Omnitrophota bacterium]